MHDISAAAKPQNRAKFVHPLVTAKGEERAYIDLISLDTLWFNTGTLCNIACKNCYIESSPTNDRLAYLTLDDVMGVLDEAKAAGHAIREIGFTGGEPFMNPAMLAIAEEVLGRGHEVLILTNAMQPLLRPAMKAGLEALKPIAGKLTIRISIDHYGAMIHDLERGAGAFDKTIEGLLWLVGAGFKTTIASRRLSGETEAEIRTGFAQLCARLGLPHNAEDAGDLIVFPEMDMKADVPEITTACWGILKKSPDAIMCASSRMVVKRRGANQPTIVPCTLLPYEPAFDLGPDIAEATKGAGKRVRLNHPHCAKFCVLGGGACS